MRALGGKFACVVLAVLLCGCAEIDKVLQPPPPPPPPPSAAKPAPPTPERLVAAFDALNRALQEENEKLLRERGTRLIGAPRAVSFGALQAALVRLGMIVENRDPDFGVLAVAAPAPKPLDSREWETTVRADTPFMGRVTCPILGDYCRNLKFDPEDFVIVINATVAEAGGGSEVSLTARMREIAPRQGLPRREYPPPTGVRIALDKIWGSFERELAARGGR